MKRTAEDVLREEYASLLPELRFLRHVMQVTANHSLLDVRETLGGHERIDVESRVKSCESAIDKVRRRTEGGTFDPSTRYSLTQLKDLVGVRVLVFPKQRAKDAIIRLKRAFPRWRADHLPALGVYKFHGKIRPGDPVGAEYQVVPALVGMFWAVEHDTFYKPDPALRGAEKHPRLQAARERLEKELVAFEDTFQEVVEGGPPRVL